MQRPPEFKGTTCVGISVEQDFAPGMGWHSITRCNTRRRGVAFDPHLGDEARDCPRMQRPPEFKGTTCVGISVEQDFASGMGWHSITRCNTRRRGVAFDPHLGDEARDCPRMQRPPEFKGTTCVGISVEQDFASGMGWHSITRCNTRRRGVAFDPHLGDEARDCPRMQRPPEFKGTTCVGISVEQDFASGVGWHSITIGWAYLKEWGRMRRPYKICGVWLQLGKFARLEPLGEHYQAQLGKKEMSAAW